jgi:hypothetical protein
MRLRVCVNAGMQTADMNWFAAAGQWCYIPAGVITSWNALQFSVMHYFRVVTMQSIPEMYRGMLLILKYRRDNAKLFDWIEHGTKLNAAWSDLILDSINLLSDMVDVPFTYGRPGGSKGQPAEKFQLKDDYKPDSLKNIHERGIFRSSIESMAEEAIKTQVNNRHIPPNMEFRGIGRVPNYMRGCIGPSGYQIERWLHAMHGLDIVPTRNIPTDLFQGGTPQAQPGPPPPTPVVHTPPATPEAHTPPPSPTLSEKIRRAAREGRTEQERVARAEAVAKRIYADVEKKANDLIRQAQEAGQKAVDMQYKIDEIINEIQFEWPEADEEEVSEGEEERRREQDRLDKELADKQQAAWDKQMEESQKRKADPAAAAAELLRKAQADQEAKEKARLEEEERKKKEEEDRKAEEERKVEEERRLKEQHDKGLHDAGGDMGDEDNDSMDLFSLATSQKEKERKAKEDQKAKDELERRRLLKEKEDRDKAGPSRPREGDVEEESESLEERRKRIKLQAELLRIDEELARKLQADMDAEARRPRRGSTGAKGAKGGPKGKGK